MPSCVSPAGKRTPARTGARRRAFFGAAVCVLAIFLGLLNRSEATTKTVTIPLSLGQEVPLHAPFTRSYSAVQQVAGVAATASFTLTLSASPFDVIFSEIVVNKLTGDLTAVHIHGPCPDENPCTADVVFLVCGGSCPVGKSVTIPAFSARNLYHDLISGNKLFYLNFHTAANPNGEIRADLFMPRGIATVVYDTESTLTSDVLTANAKALVIPADVTFSITGLTGSPVAIHLHGPAVAGVSALPLVTLCGSGSSTTNCAAALAVSNAGFVHSFLQTGGSVYTFTNVALPLELVVQGVTYFNIHTAAYPQGELRGQLAPKSLATIPPNGMPFRFYLDPLQEIRTGVSLSFDFSALPQQEVSSCARASFRVTFSSSQMTFSNIATTNLKNLLAVHIHGPCSTTSPCIAAPIYLICGNAGNPCPTQQNPVIPGFTIDPSQTLLGDGSLVLGMFAGILSGSSFYYVNFHTALYQDGGEIRADLIVPRGDVVMAYDSINNLASFTISVTGMTGPVKSARLHGPAFNGATGDLLAGFCDSTNCSLANGTPQTFANVSIPDFANLVGRGLLYVNLITDVHTGGEIRGQIMSSVAMTGFQGTYAFMPRNDFVPKSNPAFSFQSASALLFPNASLPTTITVPISFGQEPSATLSFSATPSQETGTSSCPAVPSNTPQANFRMWHNVSSISFSDIVITGLSSNLIGVHVHGPCPSYVRCNANVVYVICQGNSSSPCIPSGTAGTIGGFTINAAQAFKSNKNFNIHSLIHGDELYYLNLHTVNNAGGELRADLVVPRGVATVTYTPAFSSPTYQQFGQFRALAVKASVSFDLTGLTGTINAIHLHGMAGFGQSSNILATLCDPSNLCNQKMTMTLDYFPINVVASGGTYFNVHTAQNPGGEARGQVTAMTTPANSINRGMTLTLYSDSLCTAQVTDLVVSVNGSRATSAWNIPNPLVAEWNSCVAAGSRLDHFGSSVVIFVKVLQCSSQGGSIYQMFTDSSCTIAFAPPEMIPASNINQCVMIYPRNTTGFPTGLYVTDSCSGAVSVTLPLSVYEENSPFRLSVTGSVGQQIPSPSQGCAQATFNVTFDPTNQGIIFSDIPLQGLSSALTASHIHGPCPSSAPCNAPPIYMICGPAATPCPAGPTPTIPSFIVDRSKSIADDGSVLLGLYESILSGRNLYYVNFHTESNPDGEVRANLILPEGVATVSYDPIMRTTDQEFGTGNSTFTLPSVSANITINVARMSGLVVAAHLHGPATHGGSDQPVTALCNDANSCNFGGNSGPSRSFGNVIVPKQLLERGLLYLNLHTAQFPQGEVRGQVLKLKHPAAAQQMIPSPPSIAPAPSTMSTVTFPLSGLQAAAANNITLQLNATSSSEIIDRLSALCNTANTLAFAEFKVTFTPDGLIVFSDIPIVGLTSTLSAVHIHGPCPTNARCNANVVYCICGGCPGGSVDSCPNTQLNGITTISSFTVNTSQTNSAPPGELAALYLKILDGQNSYYVNFHTAAFVSGELRADIVVPTGSVSIAFDSTSATTPMTMGGVPNVQAIPATITVSLSGMSSKAPNMIMLHAPAGMADTANMLIMLCGGSGSSDCVLTDGRRTFPSINVPISLLNAASNSSLNAWPYVNVHSSLNPAGELRGILVQRLRLPPAASTLGAAYFVYEDAACTRMSFADNSTQFSSVVSRPWFPGGNGLRNPTLFPDANTCNFMAPRGVYDRVTQCASTGVTVVSYSDAQCTKPIRQTTLPLQCIPIPGTSLYLRPICSSSACRCDVPAAAQCASSCVVQPFQYEVPLDVLQLNTNSVSFAYTANAAQDVAPAFVSSCSSAKFDVSFTKSQQSNQPNTILFSNIVFTGALTSNLKAAHIHGPCPSSAPCNAPPIYMICGPAATPCPAGPTPTIPSFIVDRSKSIADDGSVLLGLYESILSGRNLYYVNFHTERFASGEIRANLYVPRGSAVITVNIAPGNFTQPTDVLVSLENLKGMPNYIELTVGQSRAAGVLLCSGSIPLGSAQLGMCEKSVLQSTGLFSFSQRFTTLVPWNFAQFMSVVVGTTAAANPGELRGQLVQTYQNVNFAGPAPSPSAPPTISSTSLVVSETVPLNFGQATANAETRPVWRFIATPDATGSCVVSSSSAVLGLSFDSDFIYISIDITNLQSALTAVYIRGPCSSPSCHASPIFTVCGTSDNPCPLTLANGQNSLKIFPIALVTSTGLYGLAQDIVNGRGLYYVSFHTNAFPAGELRANLVLPNGTATIVYDRSAVPTTVMFDAPVGPQLSLLANISIAVTGVTGNILAAHLHGPAFYGSKGSPFFTLCDQKNPCNAAVSSGFGQLFSAFGQTFANVPIPVVLLTTHAAYINLHTAANQDGEARGQLSLLVPPTTAPGNNVGNADLDVLQETEKRTFEFTATAAQNHAANILSSARATFSLTFDPSKSEITISDIIFQNLTTELTGIHIHGPCPRDEPCNTNVVYIICMPTAGCPTCDQASATPIVACPAVRSGILPSRKVSGFREFGLYQNILLGRQTYYMNIHTTDYPQGEIRANLVVPVGSMSYQYSIDTASNGISSTIPFTLTLSAFDLTGPPTAIHIHGPADVGVSSSVAVSVCGTQDTPGCNLPSSNTASSVYADFAARQVYQQTFSLQLPKAVLSSAYVNIHTAKNPSGELRGQLALIRRLPSLMRVIPITEPQRNPPPSGAPPAPSSSSSGSGQASALSRGAQAAIAIGVVFACIIMGAVGFVAYKRRQNAVKQQQMVLVEVNLPDRSDGL